MEGLHMSYLVLNPFRFLGIGAIAEKKEVARIDFPLYKTIDFVMVRQTL
jgi:hypothetical protein